MNHAINTRSFIATFKLTFGSYACTLNSVCEIKQSVIKRHLHVKVDKIQNG